MQMKDKKILQTEILNAVEEDIIGELLFKEGETEKTKRVIYGMWKKREKKRKTLEMTNGQN